jgi:hypothetical protein
VSKPAEESCPSPSASENRSDAPPAAGAASEQPAGGNPSTTEPSSSQPIETPSTDAPKAQRTSSGLKDRARQALAKLAEETADGGMKLPLDDSWYVRWDGWNYDLVEMRLPDATHALTKNATTPRHLVRAHCGGSLRYALKLYAHHALAGSNAGSHAAVLRKLDQIDQSIQTLINRLGTT